MVLTGMTLSPIHQADKRGKLSGRHLRDHPRAEGLFVCQVTRRGKADKERASEKGSLSLLASLADKVSLMIWRCV